MYSLALLGTIILQPNRRFGQNISAAGLGLEPRYHPPEGCVLPLDDPAKIEKSRYAHSLLHFAFCLSTLANSGEWQKSLRELR